MYSPTKQNLEVRMNNNNYNNRKIVRGTRKIKIDLKIKK
jgi:hypothetical protein